jgi:rhamnosyltransferase
VRSLGYRWEILPASTLLYRQHASNSFGARKGFAALTKRLQMIKGGWMREQVLVTADLIEQCSDVTPLVSKYKKWILTPSLANKLALFLSAPNLRRRRLDALVLATLFITGLFWPKTSAEKL